MESLLIQANAKLNLDLEIVGKRADGYHLIESTFQSIDLSDFLLFEKSRKNSFSGAIICPESEDIILRAKKILEKTLKRELPCKIHLQKTIPIAAGLGGGSADAAATLFALNLLYKLNLSKKELAEIGTKIGADVPFFFYGGTCKVEGIGEKIAPAKKKLPRFFLVFRPHKRLETKKMYELYDETGKSFLTLAKEICPDIEKLEKHFSKFSLKLKMSGSGPTVFSGLNDHNLAEKVIKSYPSFNGDIFICHPQNRALKIL